jgi:Na+-driven multidrug efflux pump
MPAFEAQIRMLCSDYNVGVARGCGWQKIGAWINLSAYYIVGIPSAYLIAFVLHVGGTVCLTVLNLQEFLCASGF